MASLYKRQHQKGTTISVGRSFMLRMLPLKPLALPCSSIDRTLPFELRALEAALAHTCRSMEQESIQVERKTLPSLKALMQKVHH